MEKEDIRIILEKQQRLFASGKTLDISYRLSNLKRLRELIIEHGEELKESLWKDFHKPACEVISSELNFVIKELNYTISNLRKWAKPKRVTTPLIHFIAKSYVTRQPYGQVLIISPWNFPFQLAMVPVVGALAAGNCVILKASQQAPATAALLEKIISRLDNELIAVINGDHDTSEYLLNHRFDYIFFTGSPAVGSYVMGKAAKNLIPVSLELGGKSPCIVASDARLDYAAKRIAWGKFYNAGQVCVSPDYLLIDEKVKAKFLSLLKKEIESFYGTDPELSPDFPRIVSSSKTVRFEALLNNRTIFTGGKTDISICYVAPTVLTDITLDDAIMKEEIFGPVLPVIEFKNIEEIYPIIEKNPKPLAAYIFTRSRKLYWEFLARVRSGSAAVNDTVIQFASPYLPFGGIGSSGIGRYHGKKTFETFSNLKGVMIKSNLLDVFLRYPPYNRLKERTFDLLMR